MDFHKKIASLLSLPENKVQHTIDLLKNDNTIPFIARYRKEVTGNLDEEQIRSINDELHRLENLESRRETILQSIEEQGKLTDVLKDQILSAENITNLEDIYLPYRPKRRTKAMIAREKGLEPLAHLIIQQEIRKDDLKNITLPFLSQEVQDTDSAINGAKDIVAEIIADNALVRQYTREKGMRNGKVISEKIKGAEDPLSTYELYYTFSMPVRYTKPHQVLALNRGENDKILRVSIEISESDWRTAIQMQFPLNPKSVFYPLLRESSDDSAKRLLLPAIERDIRRHLTENAEDHAINIFANNLRALLTQPPLSGQIILAIDPGFRTGSKIVVIDQTGKLLDTATIYPHPPQNEKERSYQVINALIEKFHVSLIVIGNGTASRETEAFVAELTKNNINLNYLITSEAGASVYSASPLARKEFPNLDVSIRGAVSIGRRVQDPLAELVKIDPKSIGVGLYQHDINQTKLSDMLQEVVESVVNSVGVEVNTASPSLLTHVSGIGPNLAEKVVAFREENGSFKSREELLKIPGMGPKTFEQSAGFLRIHNSQNPLDATSIHPESYDVAYKVLEMINFPENPKSDHRMKLVSHFRQTIDIADLANSLNIGIPTLNDIFDELARPGRDPREDLPKPILRKDILSMEDLSPGMQLKGTIRNVVDFGAFVDIGVKTDGLLHRSKYVKGKNLQVGDIIVVEIISIDHDRHRIALDMQEKAG
jgi:uncharacterized protein